MKMLKKINIWVSAILLLSFLNSQAQDGSSTDGRDMSDQYRAIRVTVPFLTITPDSRSGALGDAGVASSPDINSQHWNAAKYPFIDKDMGFSLSYTPWLRNLIGEINLAYLSGYKKIDNNQVVSGSLRYFSLGSINFTDNYGGSMGSFSPNEFAIDVGYSRKFSPHFGGGMVFRFLRSDLSGQYFIQGTTSSRPGIAYAADISSYYTNEIDLGDKDGEISFGINLSNIGTKISYTEAQSSSFIPMNFRLGTALKVNLDEYNDMTFLFDINKLLVPSPPIYYADGEITDKGDTISSGKLVVKDGKDPDVTVITGMIQSFYDAPDGFREELSELMYSVGVEYWYMKQFAARVGYFHEHQNKGNRKYLTAGVGLKYTVFSLDFAYLVPTSGRSNPLANTVRFTLGFDLGAM